MMDNDFDSMTSMKSWAGRDYHIEYATEAVSLATTCLAIITEEGIVAAAERKAPMKIFDDFFPIQKILRLNENMVCGVAGIASEAHFLIAEMRRISESIYGTPGNRITNAELVSELSKIQRQHSMDADKRPFQASVLYVGWDSRSGFQLFEIDPSGIYESHRAIGCIGYNAEAAKAMMQQELVAKGGVKLTLKDAQIMAIKVLSMTLETSKLSPYQVEMGVLKRCEFQTVYIPTTRKEIALSIEKCGTVQMRANRKNSIMMARRHAYLNKILSPAGYQHQTNYAKEAVYRSATCLGILSKDGIVMAVERRDANEASSSDPTQKIFPLSGNLVCGMVGFASDIKLLATEIRQMSLNYVDLYQEMMPSEDLMREVSKIKTHYAESMAKRTFGVSIIYLTWDYFMEFMLFKSDPSGKYDNHEAICVGRNSGVANAMLMDEMMNYGDQKIPLEQAKILAIKVLSKAMETSKLSADQVEMVALHRCDERHEFTRFKNEEVTTLIEKCGTLQ